MRHGTLSGRNWHYRTGVPCCPECKKAHADYSRRLRRYGPAPRWGLAEQIIDVVASCDPVTPLELSALLPTANPESLRRVTYRLLDRGLVDRVDGRLVAR